MKNNAYIRTLLVLSFLLCGFALAAACIGRLSTNPLDVYNAVKSWLGIMPPAVNESLESLEAAEAIEAMKTVLFKIRIPRLLASIMIGAMLSLRGGLSRNFQKPSCFSRYPEYHREPAYAAAAILLGLGMAERQAFAFVGGILAVLLATAIPKLLKIYSNLVLVLSGIIVGGFLSSMLAILKFVAEEQTELSAIVFWQMGVSHQLT